MPGADRVYDYAKKRNSNLVSPPDHAALGRILELGFVDVARDLHPNDPGFSWFAYSYNRFAKRLGYRLDLVLASPAALTFASCRSALEWRPPGR